ncbi:MAG: MBL fold metallo-hydrolase [Verrucomicrobia bacterium]|nr:MBL fold metallo-hydrolase [Verrucomicrobiota bacterium]
MRLTFFGAAQRTTGSKYLIEANGRRVLLECGMYQGHRDKSTEYNTTLPFDATSVDAMVLSHAHIDHSGIIPVLCRDGFRGSIHCTDATADLCNYMLLDSAHIQEQDAVFVSKKRAKKGLPPVKPLYTQADAIESLKQFAPIRYGTPTQILDGVTATFLDAGHILGSAIVVLDLEENSRRVRLAFSGDLGRGNNDILRDPAIPQDVDCLMIESTYGNRDHEPMDDVNDHVCRIIRHSVERRGKVIIPSFAVGRTQQILYTLFQLTQSHCIPPLKVFVDSPLAINATAVFRTHHECFNEKFRAVALNGNSPFAMPNLTYVGAVEQSMAINDLREPCIIVSASGMAEAGRVRHHIKNNIEDPNATILIVGWCAAHTLGGHLASGEKRVNIFGEPHRVRCKVEVINAFSGHADRNELRAWTSQLTGALKNIFVIHGEPEPAAAFAGVLRQTRHQSDVHVPEFQDSFEF